MSEVYPNPDLLPAQEALHDTCSVILETMPEPIDPSGHGNATVYTQISAASVQKNLRESSLEDLLLPNSASLSIDNPDGRASRKKSFDAEERLRARWLGDSDLILEEQEEDSQSADPNRMGMPDLKLYAGTKALKAVGVDVRRRVSPDINYWEDRLSIFFRYDNDEHEAFEFITARTGSYHLNGLLRVQLQGNVKSPSYYGGMDYGGHMPVYRLLGQQKQDTGEEVFRLVELAHDLVSNPAKE